MLMFDLNTRTIFKTQISGDNYNVHTWFWSHSVAVWLLEKLVLAHWFLILSDYTNLANVYFLEFP